MAKISKDHIYLFFEHGIDISTKTLYMGGEDEEKEIDLDSGLTARVIKGLRVLSAIRPEDPIHIILNNQGGDTQHGLAIYDAIRMVPGPVHITVMGHCYSMAAWVLQAGDIRRMTKHSSIMIHDGDSTVSGKKEETRNWFKFYQEQDEICRQILLSKIKEKHPDFPPAKLMKMLKTDTILWAPQALELGLVDEIVGDE
jgi:ATP-dependent Clp protease, protease subunit